MTYQRTLWLLIALLGPSTAALANPELAKKKNCLVACHEVDKKVIGPSFKDVAAKYAKDPDAPARLTKKVLKGGTGVWGVAVMPPAQGVSDAEARQLVDWILSLK